MEQIGETRAEKESYGYTDEVMLQPAISVGKKKKPTSGQTPQRQWAVLVRSCIKYQEASS